MLERVQRILEGELERFEREHPRSRELATRARSSLLAGVPMHWMVRWPGGFPVFARMIELAERFERGVQEAIDERSLPWHVTRLGCRVEYLFSRERPVNGSEAASGSDASSTGSSTSTH